MLETNEFEKIRNSLRSRKEMELVDCDEKFVREISRRFDIEEFPIVLLIANIKSVHVYREIVTFMIDVERKYKKGETEDGTTKN